MMLKTLIVEDDDIFRQTLIDLLLGRFPSMPLRESRDGEGILGKIKDFEPDLIFMDIKLPGESGLQLTKRIKNKYPHITVIILTSYNYPEYEQAAFENGANYFVSKHAATAQEILNLVDTIVSHTPGSATH
jgi:DNA-binding NarL/FixJ family response regulator